MTNIEEVKEQLKDAKPGARLLVKGYVDSDGNTRDLEVELLTRDDYGEMQEEDLSILKDCDVEKLDLGEISVADAEAARADLISRRQKAVSNREAGQAGAGYRGPAYETIGGSLAVHPDKPGDAVYLQRLRVGEPSEPKPAKGAVPRAKQFLAKELDLPTRYYAQNIKLADGRFDEILLLT